MVAGQKKTLIPCYKNLDAYDMPKEFRRLQAQDMGKVGAVQDLLRGINKIFDKGTVQMKEAKQCSVQDWYGIMAVSCGNDHTVGLNADGTVVAAGYNNKGRCNVQDWRDIVAVTCGRCHTVGLKSDGTIVVTGDNSCSAYMVQSWKLFNNFVTLEQERAEAKMIAERCRQEKAEAEHRQRKKMQSVRLNHTATGKLPA